MGETISDGYKVGGGRRLSISNSRAGHQTLSIYLPAGGGPPPHLNDQKTRSGRGKFYFVFFNKTWENTGKHTYFVDHAGPKKFFGGLFVGPRAPKTIRGAEGAAEKNWFLTLKIRGKFQIFWGVAKVGGGQTSVSNFRRPVLGCLSVSPRGGGPP